MERKLSRVLLAHPLLIAVYPVLSLYWHNIYQLTFDQTWELTAILVGLALSAWLLLWVLLKDCVKAALITSVFEILNFSYASVGLLVYHHSGGKVHPLVIFAVWLLFLFVLVRKIVSGKINLRFFSVALTVTGFSLFSFLSVKIGGYEFQRYSQRHVDFHDTLPVKDVSSPASGEEPPPDIYYLIFDRYPSGKILREDFGFDNSPFENYLRSKGFYIVEDSRANYPRSFLSLASSLNLGYLNYLEGRRIIPKNDRIPGFRLLEDYHLWRFLKQRGYQFIHMGGWWQPTQWNPHADLNLNCIEGRLNAFTSMWLVQTMLYQAVHLATFGQVDRYFARAPLSVQEMVLCQFREVAEAAGITGPKFLFAHFSFPHFPAVFGPAGEWLTPRQVKERGVKENFINQLIFANVKIKELIDNILSASKKPPVIVIQSDEGPCVAIEGFEFTCGDELDWREISISAIRSHVKILNAVYLPGADASELFYPTETPVNTFRIILNRYFGEDLEILADESYVFETLRNAYHFVNITDRLNEEERRSEGRI